MFDMHIQTFHSGHFEVTTVIQTSTILLDIYANPQWSSKKKSSQLQFSLTQCRERMLAGDRRWRWNLPLWWAY